MRRSVFRRPEPTDRRANGVAVAIAVGIALAGLLSDDDPAESAYPGSNGKIAFETSRDGNLEIYSMNPDGSAQANLTSDPTEDTDPEWSPDGTRIAFVKASEGHRNIYVMNADGSGQTNLTPGPETTGQANGGTNPTWSPDGIHIAFAASQGDIWVMIADGSGKTNLTNTSPTVTVPAVGVESQTPCRRRGRPTAPRSSSPPAPSAPPTGPTSSS